MFRNFRSTEPASTAGSTTSPAAVPPLDLLVPAHLDTATFAVG